MTQTVFGMGGGGAKWRSEPRPAASGRNARRARMSLYKKLAATLAALAVIGFGLYFELRVWRTTPVVAYCAIDYPAPIPPNAWAWEDREAWDQREFGSYLRPVKADLPLPNGENASTAAIHKEWLAQLGQYVADEGADVGAEGMVVYLSLHGVVDDRDTAKPRACLLLPRASMELPAWRDETNWLPLADVLDALEQAAAPHGTHVLLALDANRIDTLWDLGMLHNAFASVAAKEVAEGAAKRPHVSVLNSTGEGEWAWTSPELGRSVFGYFFEQGLRGAADGNGDQQIDLRELHGYVRGHVDRFVRAQYGPEVRQLPTLWPAGEQINPMLAYCESGYEAPARQPLSTSRDQLASALQRFQGVFAERSVSGYRRVHPVGWEQWRRDLTRLEQLLAAGTAYKKSAADGGIAHVESATALLTRMEQPVAASAPFASLAAVDLSLPWKARFGGDSFAALSEAQRQSYARQVAEIATGPAAPAAEAAAPPAADAASKPASGDAAASSSGAEEKPANDASKAAEPPAAGAPQRKLIEEPDRTIRTAVAWRWFCDGRRTREQVERVLGTLLPPKSGPEDELLIELQWMRLLVRDIETRFWDEHAGLVMALAQVREASEETAAMMAPRTNSSAPEPLDLRGFGILAERLSQVETRRRACEDAAFVGEAAAADTLGTAADALMKEYQAVQELAFELDQARKFWEEAVSESPALIAWQVRRTQFGAALVLDADSTRRMLENCDQLADVLNQSQRLFAGTKPESGDHQSDLDVAQANLKSARDAAQILYSRLRSAYEQELAEVGRNIEQGLNPIDLRRAELLLSGPMPGFGNRERLWAQRDRLAESLVNQTAEATAPESKTSSNIEPLRVLAAWALRDANDETPSSPASAAELRERLAKAPSVEKALPAAWQSAGRGPALLALDLRARRQAAISPAIVQLSGKSPEPAAQLAWWEHARYLQWFGQQLLDDFLGDATPELAQETAKTDSRDWARHYFARAAQQLITNTPGFAENSPRGEFSVVPEAATAIAEVGKSLQDQLGARQLAAQEGVAPQPPSLQAKLIGSARAAVEFQPRSKELPVGEAAVWIPSAAGLSADSGEDPLRRNPRQVGPGTIARLPIAFSWESATSGELVPTMFYRGHYWRGRREIPAIGDPLAVRFDRQTFYLPQVTVHDPITQRVAFSIILDCSGSMLHEGNNRLTVAKDALRASLAPVARSGRHRASLWLFGHQVKAEVNEDQSAYNLRPSGFATRKMLPVVHPDDDVEKFQPIAPLNDRSLGALMDKLNDPAIAPWGSTPLYVAIAEALEQDARDLQRDAEARRERYLRHILVITDGNDDRIVDRENRGRVNEENRVQPPPQLKQPTPSELADLFRRYPGVKLDVIGFPLKPGEAYNPELVRLAERTKGIFVPNAKSEELIAHLKRAIGMRSYQVFRADGAAVADPALLNDSVSVNKPESAPAQAVFAKMVEEPGDVKSDPFPLLRSEAIDLYLTEADRRGSLVHRRVTDDDPNARPVETADGAYVTLHKTTSAPLGDSPQDLVTFRASLQHNDAEKYLPPPAEAWLEVDLPLPGGHTRTYWAYDRNLVAQQSAATLAWTVDGFPLAQSVELADVRLWWRNEPSAIKKRIPIAELREPEELLDVAQGVTLLAQVDGNKLVIQEQHADGSPDQPIPWLRVDVSLASEYIGSIRREFFPEIRSARHTFEFQGDNLPAIESAEIVLRDLAFERASAGDVHFVAFPRINLPTHSAN